MSSIRALLVLIAVILTGIPALYLFPLGLPSASAQSAASADQARSDFNGDGYDDLAIGTPQDRKGTIIEIGSVNVLYGSSSGLQTSSPADQLWNQESANVEGAGRQFERFGHSVAAHDFNGDGVDDLAVGVPQDGSPSESGAVNVLYGDSDGLQTTSPRDQYWHADSSSVKGTPDETREFGWFLG